jgi:outer membrane protein TolC
VETTRVAHTAAEEAYRVRKEMYRVGKATSVELSDAEANLFRAKLAAVSARIDQRIARTRLDHAVGRALKPRLFSRCPGG